MSCPVSPDDELRGVQIRPTRQRVALLRLIRGGGHRHLSAEQVFRESAILGLRLSLATVYNTLNLFTQAGLLRRIDVAERTWFCTNRADHHHLYDETECRLTDIPSEQITVTGMPELPEDAEIIRTDIVIRFRRVKV